MPTPVILPKLEMLQETGVIVEWLKREGDQVTRGEPLFVVETDKVTVEVEAPASGILTQVEAQPGQSLPVTSQIALILSPGEGAEPGEDPTPVTQTPPATPLASRMAAAEGLDLAGVPGSGPGGKITRADVQGALKPQKGADLQPLPASPPSSRGQAGAVSEVGKVRASPAARRIARERGVDLGLVAGSGLGGRIQGPDVLEFSRQAHALQPDEQEWTAVPLQGMRRKIAERLAASYRTAPHVAFTTRVDMTGFETAREQFNQRAKRAGEAHVSVTALLVRLVGAVLPNHSMLNAQLAEDESGEAEIHLMKRVNVGVAVALPDGLIVPVIRDADRKPLRQVAREVEELAEKARSGKLTPPEVAGGTFTVSNLGPFGIEQFTAILNPGQTGILAVGATAPEPMAAGDQVQIRPVARMTLSVDHRVVDGAVAAHFMAELKETLETPSLALW